jgi:hypothetical protein
VLTLGLSRLNLLMDLYGDAPVIQASGARRRLEPVPAPPATV